MKVSGFTFVRNAVKFDYPVAESIRSILPVCDEFVVAVGNSEDGTRQLVESLNNPKIRIIDTVWDDSLRTGGRVLAVETDKALAAVDPESTWAFYLQADEVIHEQDLPVIVDRMKQYEHRHEVDGVLFRYLHFYGSYDFFGDSRAWYRNEVRVIRVGRDISSWGDAQGFRRSGEKLNVVPVDATVYHYGWVKPPASQQAKQGNFHRYWHSDQWINRQVAKTEEFDYSAIDSLAHFTGAHPRVMKDRIAQKNWKFDFDPSGRKINPVQWGLRYLENLTGWRPGEYRNYRLIK